MSDKNTKFSKVADNVTKLQEAQQMVKVSVRSEPEYSPESPQPVRRGRAPGKKTNPDYTQVTVYLRKDTYTEARQLLFGERRQFSDLVNSLVTEWLEVQNSKSPKL